MSRAITAKGGMAGLGTRDWGLGTTENLPEPGLQNPPPSCASQETLGCELAAEVLRSFGRLRFRATGASMLPAVWPGDVLSVRRHGVEGSLPGDVVLFSREGRLVAHRVVERTLCQDRIRWVTRGDSVDGNDAPVSSRELLGRVTTIERGSRRLTPRQSLAGRLISGILSRSDFATRLLLRVGKPGFGTRVTGLGKILSTQSPVPST